MKTNICYRASGEKDDPLEEKIGNSVWVRVRVASSGFGPNEMSVDTISETLVFRAAAFRRLSTSRETITGVSLVNRK